MKYLIAISSLLAVASAAHAQAIKGEPELERFTAEQQAEITDPDLLFEGTERDVSLYEKYFYFHREDTDFDRAFADINECDALSRGAGYYRTNASYYTPQSAGLVGAAGSVIGALIADAIFGSAERRRVRRVNLRNCMAFKGYSRYGLEKERWQKFHFEEGFGEARAEKRREYFLMQAKVASGPKPSGKALEK